MPFPVVSTLLILQANNHIHGIAGVRAHVHAHSPAFARIIAFLAFDARHTL